MGLLLGESLVRSCSNGTVGDPRVMTCQVVFKPLQKVLMIFRLWLSTDNLAMRRANEGVMDVKSSAALPLHAKGKECSGQPVTW